MSLLNNKIGWKGLLCSVIIVMTVYSFLPFVLFLFREEASFKDNNIKASELLQKNKGDYFSFIVFGDTHAGLIFNDAAALKEIWHMNREDRFRKAPIDFVLNTGDISLNGERASFCAFKKLQKLIKYPLITAIGNHDGIELFNEFYGKENFVFVDRNSYFIILDNRKGELNEEQFEWLISRLKEARKYIHIFIVMHKPPFDPYQQDWYNEDNGPWSYRFRKLCSEYSVNTVFSGHKHMFKHEQFEDVNYIVTGGGGMLIEIPEIDGGYLHYVRVMVNHDYVTYEVRKISPPLWEYFSYYIWKEMLYWIRNFYGTGYIFRTNAEIEPLRVEKLNDPEYWINAKPDSNVG